MKKSCCENKYAGCINGKSKYSNWSSKNMWYIMLVLQYFSHKFGHSMFKIDINLFPQCILGNVMNGGWQNMAEGLDYKFNLTGSM